MAKWRNLAALCLAAAIVLAPALANARAGGSYRSGGGGSFMSQGSLGSHTYNSPMQRSLTPQTPLSGSQPGLGSGFGGYGAAHPFLSGLAGGLFGGFLGSMLFPHWGMGYAMGFGGGVIGPIFTWMLILWLLWMGYRMFARRYDPLGTTVAAPLLRGGVGGMRQGYGAIPAAGAPLAIAGTDYQAFEVVLKNVQGAWSKGDLAELRHWVTPEMLSYFAEELAGNESQGVTNKVEDLELLRGDLREAWDEGQLHYATCALAWRARDYTVRSDRRPGDPGFVVSGDPRQPSDAAEIWTFARSPGGHWLLSAIQQP